LPGYTPDVVFAHLCDVNGVSAGGDLGASHAALAPVRFGPCRAACGVRHPKRDNSTAGIKDLAAFLMVVRPYAYFGCSNWEDVPTWPKQYDMPLGAPLGHAALGGDGTWRRRRFRTGTTASINYHAGVASIDWGTAATPTTGEND